MSQLVLTRRASFTCVHKYVNPKWSEKENREVFGLCYSQWGHGHNYDVEVSVSGPLDPRTGMILNLAKLDQHLNRVLQKLDGKNINAEISEFYEMIPTTENLIAYIQKEIEPLIKSEPGVVLERIRLYEAPTLWVDWIRSIDGIKSRQ